MTTVHPVATRPALELSQATRALPPATASPPRTQPRSPGLPHPALALKMSTTNWPCPRPALSTLAK
eukprot:5072108-Prymnesium_polylepis.1